MLSGYFKLFRFLRAILRELIVLSFKYLSRLYKS